MHIVNAYMYTYMCTYTRVHIYVCTYTYIHR